MRIKMPPGYYIEWSGQYESQISARKRLEMVIPLVLVVIFVLLYRTYRSAKEAAHVLLGRSVCAERRYLSGQSAGAEFFRGCMGWFYRTLRDPLCRLRW